MSYDSKEKYFVWCICVISFALGISIATIAMSIDKEETTTLRAKYQVCDDKDANFKHSSFYRFTDGVLVKKKSNKFMITIVCEDK